MLRRNSDNQKRIWQRLVPGLVVIAITIVFFILFMVNNNQRVTVQNGNYVSDAAEQTASRISNDLYTAVRTLNNISEMCDVEEDNSYPEQLKRIDDPIFSVIDYISVDGKFTENGKTYYLGTLYGFRNTECKPGNDPDFVVKVTTKSDYQGTDYSYISAFERGMKVGRNEAGMREEFRSATNLDDNYMSFYTAMFDSTTFEDDGNRVGVLIGRYNEEKMKDILETSFFGENSGVFLCKDDGTLITTTSEYLYERVSDDQKDINVYDLLSEIVDETTFKQLDRNFRQDAEHSNKFSFSFSSSRGTVNACFVHLPLNSGISADNWIILQTFPATVTTQMQKLANLEGVRLGLGLFFALAIYIGLILLLNHFQNKKLVKDNVEMAYVVEGLTNLYDRLIYVNLNEKTFKYVGRTYPGDGTLPEEGDYSLFKDAFISTINDEYEKASLLQKFEVEEIKKEMSDGTSHLRYEYRANTEGRWDDMSLICLSRDENGAKEVLFARQDISEFKAEELHKQWVLKEAFRAAEDANRAKSDFLANMSHDIRTPMNAVLGFSTLIESSADNPEKVSEYNKKIQSAGRHLIDLINDLLDMSKIESGKFTLNMAKFNLTDLVDEICSVMAPNAKTRGQTFNLTVDEELQDKSYLGDVLRIKQIIINVISNAIKYTPEGGQIDFTVRKGENFSDNISNIVFTVRDNGIGMSEEFQKRMFLPFEREERSTTRKVQGTGLGMPIAKNLVELMGGTIEVESKENVGTTLTVYLRLAAVEQSEHQATAHSADTAANPLEGKSFLVAEDNDINAEIIGELLELSGAKCEIAENGEIAVELFERSKPGRYDMILMDVQMPVMDGYAATRAIRSSEHPEAKTIPIVAMTANAFAEDVNNSFNAGMNAHLAKPVSLDNIKGVVEKLIDNKE